MPCLLSAKGWLRDRLRIGWTDRDGADPSVVPSRNHREASEYGKPYRLTTEQEQSGVISIVAYSAQHNPGVSVGDWSDEQSVDPMYDAIEAIRPQLGM
jgi:hypothetical protein